MRMRNLSAAAIFLIDIPTTEAQAHSVHWNQRVAASNVGWFEAQPICGYQAPVLEIGPALPASPGVLDLCRQQSLYLMHAFSQGGCQ
jgi:hypothetical protein